MERLYETVPLRLLEYNISKSGRDMRTLTWTAAYRRSFFDQFILDVLNKELKPYIVDEFDIRSKSVRSFTIYCDVKEPVKINVYTGMPKIYNIDLNSVEHKDIEEFPIIWWYELKFTLDDTQINGYSFSIYKDGNSHLMFSFVPHMKTEKFLIAIENGEHELKIFEKGNLWISGKLPVFRDSNGRFSITNFVLKDFVIHF
jgi:hypothetical protein